MREVEPYEARGLEILGDGDTAKGLHDLCVAVNGFYYPGDRADALIVTVAYLQTRPDLCAALKLGETNDA